MSNVLNRTTKEYRESANEPDFPQANWIWNLDLSAVSGFDSRYRTITGDVVTLMTLAERNAVDAALSVASRDSVAAELDQIENIPRAVVLVIRDELNLHADKMNSILTAIDTSTTYATLKTNIAAIV